MTNLREVGRKAVFTNATLHEEIPDFYPKAGTIGNVLLLDEDADIVYVDWGDSTNAPYRWWADLKDVQMI